MTPDLLLKDVRLLKIQSCRTPEEVLSAVQDWEAQQIVSGIEPAP